MEPTAAVKPTTERQNPEGDSTSQGSHQDSAHGLRYGEGAGGEGGGRAGQTLLQEVGNLVQAYSGLDDEARCREQGQQPESPGAQRLMHRKINFYRGSRWGSGQARLSYPQRWPGFHSRVRLQAQVLGAAGHQQRRGQNTNGQRIYSQRAPSSTPTPHTNNELGCQGHQGQAGPLPNAERSKGEGAPTDKPVADGGGGSQL